MDELDVQVVGAEPAPNAYLAPRAPKWLVGGLIVVAVAFAAGVMFNVDRSADKLPSEAFAGVPLQVFDETGPTISVVPPSPATIVADPLTVGATRIELTPDAKLLEGYVALTSVGTEANRRTLWTLGPGGGLAARGDLLVASSGPPPLVTDRFVAFSDAEFGYVIDAGLVGQPAAIVTATHVIPSDARGRVWFVMSAGGELSATEVGPTPFGSEVVGAYKRPFRTGPDGLEADRSLDGSLFGVGLWASGTVVPLNGGKPTGTERGVVRIAIASETGLVRSKLISAAQVPVLAALEASAGEVSTMCIDPGSGQIAAVGSDGTLVVIGSENGAGEIATVDVQPVNGIGWTSPRQLVYLSESDSGFEIRAIDTRTSLNRRIAVVSGSTEWTLTASESSC